MSEGRKKGKGKKKNQKDKEDRKPGEDRRPRKASPPKIKKIKNQVLQEGEKLTLKCEATGNPTLTYKWYRDGTELNKSPEIKIKSGRKNSRLQISSVKLADGGDYTCEVENILGKETMKTTISIQSRNSMAGFSTDLIPGSHMVNNW
ncbi:Pro-neuregulin-2, membrane-bound isoform [Acipenser ruthenus]|uniref:Pro-neuregulin-2, membrane-bound isoform n=1 Tax=Acipenser ruthenus TaxID=7906 RepID=A0A662YM94_ACIRT|nr:Pro-neuregulin-2, membrane-bound isoform [Acipenser ruthenus]